MKKVKFSSLPVRVLMTIECMAGHGPVQLHGSMRNWYNLHPKTFGVAHMVCSKTGMMQGNAYNLILIDNILVWMQDVTD